MECRALTYIEGCILDRTTYPHTKVDAEGLSPLRISAISYAIVAMILSLSVAVSHLPYVTLLLLSPYIFLLLQIVQASCRTLLEWRRSGVLIFYPSWETLKVVIQSIVYKSRPREMFDKIMSDFRRLSSQAGGLYGWLSPLGKPFLVVTDAGVLSQIIVQNANKLTKWHAFGCLEYFRRTELPSNVNAWKVVHRVASKFPVHDEGFQSCLSQLINKYISEFASLSSEEYQDISVHTKEFYWQVVLLMVIGEDAVMECTKADDDTTTNDSMNINRFIELYKIGWVACIKCLCQVWAHMLSFYMYCWFFPSVYKYRSSADALRHEMLQRIHKHKSKCDKIISDKKSKWCILNVIENEMSQEDQLEIAMEFLFTGASSVTTVLTWLIYHIGEQTDLQKQIRNELQEVLKEDTSSSFVNINQNGQYNDFSSANWITSDALNGDSCPILEAALKETLRMYPPIHIGRLALADFEITTCVGKRVKISKGTDIMSNPWFFQRNEDNFKNPHEFDHTRFLNKTYNAVPSWHPFSLGVRSCPGMRIGFAVLKTIVANIIINYHVQIKETNPLVDHDDTCSTSPQFDSNLMLPCTPTNTFMKFKRIS